MKGFSKNTVFILFGMAGLVLTAPSQTNAPVIKHMPFPSCPADAAMDKKAGKELLADNNFSFEEARFVIACW